MKRFRMTLRRIVLSTAIAVMDPFKRRIRAFLENARYHYPGNGEGMAGSARMPDRTPHERAERSSRLTVPISIRLRD